MYPWTMKSLLNFGSNADPSPDPDSDPDHILLVVSDCSCLILHLTTNDYYWLDKSIASAYFVTQMVTMLTVLVSV